jgi:translation initiation factor 2B subunit (eIF-2B alpha/beta/delta family)
VLPPVVEEAIQGIASDRTSGASRLARLAAETMGLLVMEAKGRPDPASLTEAAGRLSDAQPTMSIVHNVAHLYARLIREGHDPRAVLAEIQADLDSAKERIARTFLKIAPEHATVVTLSHSENVLEALRTAHARGRVDRVVVLESRPLFEGRTLAASLAEGGISTTIVADAAGPSYMAEATYALLGADAVLRDSSFANKIGSYAIALAATHHGKPTYVACETLKFDARHDASTWPGSAARGPEEVWPDAPKGVEVVNRYFELVPGRLITTFVTDRGTYAPDILRTMLARPTTKA